MSTTPQRLSELGAFWEANGGVNLGSVGNQKHCYGYHLGKDRIFGNCACRPDGTCVPGQGAKDYSVQTARDKAGLTSAASAIDLGKLNGSYLHLYAFSDWLAKRCLAGHPTTGDVRDLIYSPDGQRVFGFKDGVSNLILGYGDGSHTMHTHISFYRDSESRDKRPLIADWFALPDTSTGPPAPGGDVTPAPITDPTPMEVRIPAGANIFDVDGKTVLRTSPGSAAWRVSPYEQGGKRAIFSPDPPIALVAVGAGDKRDVVVPATDCTAAVAAEHERVRAAAIAAASAL
jgi:hypothetical protein